MIRRRSVAWGLGVWMACAPPHLPDPLVADTVSATIRSSPHVAGVPWIEVAAPSDASVWIEYGLDPELAEPRSTPVHPGPDPVVAVLGLPGGQTTHWRAVVAFADGTTRTSPSGHFEAPLPPSGIPGYAVEQHTEAALGGWILTSVLRLEDDLAWVGILDRGGAWVWWIATPAGHVPQSPRLSLDGQSVSWVEVDRDRGDLELHDGAERVRGALDGSTIERTPLPRGHHDFVEHADGSLGFLSYTFVDDPRGPVGTSIIADRISELPATGRFEGVSPNPRGPAVVFDAFSDAGVSPVATCGHIAAEREILGRVGPSWTHANSLAYVPSEDAYYLNAKYTDWLWKIDRSSGQILWQLNGLGGDFTLVDGTEPWIDVANPPLWSHGHLGEVWPGGALVFDNGDHRYPQTSRVVEVAWHEGRGQAQVVWAFSHPDRGFTPSMGDARRLPGGNTLTSWSGLGEILEVTPDGTIAWGVRAHRADTVGRITWIRDLYRPDPPDPGLPPGPSHPWWDPVQGDPWPQGPVGGPP